MEYITSLPFQVMIYTGSPWCCASSVARQIETSTRMPSVSLAHAHNVPYFTMFGALVYYFVRRPQRIAQFGA